jgi:hypothetical protein
MPSLKRVTLYFILVAFAMFAYLGAFARIIVTQAVSPDRRLLGKWYIGPFSKIPAAQDELYTILQSLDKADFPLGSWCGVYVDDPSVADKDHLRWFYGVEVLVDNPTSEPWKGLNVISLHLPSSPIIRATFPLHPRFLPFSMILGVQRVYRAITRYCTENLVSHGPVTEIYSIKTREIIYEAYQEIPATLQEHLSRKIQRKKVQDEL